MAGQPRDWDREMAEIDKLLAGGASPTASSAPTKPAAASAPAPRASAPAVGTSRAVVLGLWFRLALVGGLVAAFAVWPFAKWCGGGLALYLGTIALGTMLVLSALGISWTHRRGVAHVAGLLLLAGCLGLATAEVLPRVGYAKEARPWACDLVAPSTPAPAAPASATGQPTTAPATPAPAP